MITRKLIQYYLDLNLGEPKFTHQGLKYCCKKCDVGQKYNLEISFKNNKEVFWHCWSCGEKGFINELLEKYAFESGWKNLPEFKKQKIEINEIKTKELNYPKETIPFYLDGKVLDYLTKERGIDKEDLIKRKVSYVYSKEEIYYDHICFPFYKNNKLIGACLQNFKTKKYRNLGPLNFIPYEEFINNNYPITITEGCYDALSSINAIPILKTEINKEILNFLNNKDIILALDNTIEISNYTKQLEKINQIEIKSLTLFDLNIYKDMNEYLIKDKKNFIKEYKNCFNKILYPESIEI